MKYNIPFIQPTFPVSEALAEDYKKIVENNWFTNFGPFEKEFTKKIEKFIGQNTHVAPLANATLGLISAISALVGIGDGSKYIIMPSFTFIAGAQAILWCGYKPYFVDISTETLQMDIKMAEQLLHDKPELIEGILFCNAFGVGDPAIDEWERLSEKSNKPLIIDSAAGFGSKYADGNYLGARGSCEIFSFHATKPFAIGEGGAVVSRNSDLIKKIKNIQNFGFNNSRDSEDFGFNAKLQEINAAIGVRQFVSFADRLASRRQTLNLYSSRLKKLEFQPNSELSSVCFAAALIPDRFNRDNIVKDLNSEGIQVREYYNPPIHLQEYFLRRPDIWDSTKLINTEKISKKIISLPVHDYMESETLDLIISKVSKKLL